MTCRGIGLGLGLRDFIIVDFLTLSFLQGSKLRKKLIVQSCTIWRAGECVIHKNFSMNIFLYSVKEKEKSVKFTDFSFSSVIVNLEPSILAWKYISKIDTIEKSNS